MSIVLKKDFNFTHPEKIYIINKSGRGAVR